MSGQPGAEKITYINIRETVHLVIRLSFASFVQVYLQRFDLKWGKKY